MLHPPPKNIRYRGAEGLSLPPKNHINSPKYKLINLKPTLWLCYVLLCYAIIPNDRRAEKQNRTEDLPSYPLFFIFLLKN